MPTRSSLKKIAYGLDHSPRKWDNSIFTIWTRELVQFFRSLKKFKPLSPASLESSPITRQRHSWSRGEQAAFIPQLKMAVKNASNLGQDGWNLVNLKPSKHISCYTRRDKDSWSPFRIILYNPYMFLGVGQELMFPVWQKPPYSVGQIYFVALPVFVSSIPIHHRKNEMNKINPWKPSQKVFFFSFSQKTHQKLVRKEEFICLLKVTAAKSRFFPHSQVTTSKGNCPGVVKKFLTQLLQPPLPPAHHPNNPLPTGSRFKPSGVSQSSSPNYGAALISSGQQESISHRVVLEVVSHMTVG